MNSSDWYVFLLVTGFHAQLPVWLSLLRFRKVRFTALEGLLGSPALFDVNTCAVPLDDFSLFRRAVVHCVVGTSGIHRQIALTRDSATKGSPDASAARHLSTNPSTSSGWIAAVQRQSRKSV